MSGAAITPDPSRQVLHWYDLLCPFCYVGQARNAIFRDEGLEVVELPFQAHPEIPPGGRAMGPRSGAVYAGLEAEARSAGLPLRWPDRLPDTRMALAAAEWARRNAPDAFPGFQAALFQAHFASNEDLADRSLVQRYATESGLDVDALVAALEDGSAGSAVDEAQALGASLGVYATPAWYAGGHLVPGLFPRDQLKLFARALAG